MAFVAWTEIESFHNIRKFTSAHPEILNGKSLVHYRPKVKLHGTNAAIQCHQDGRVIAQSRTAELSVGNDNAGFARWVEENKDKWNLKNNHIVYGEWIGPGIQKGVAVSTLPKKCFAVFAVRSMENPESLVIEPGDLKHIVGGIPDTYILPWYNEGLDMEWSASSETLTKDVDNINSWVSAVEENDPWVEAIFGIKGTGEGLVFYPTTQEHLGYTNFANLVFKAKGEKHKNIATAKPAQVDAASAASIDAFVSMVLTEARLDQGATAVGGVDMKLTGKFVAWVLGDVQKETQDEMAASNLDWKQVQKPLSDKARGWYLAKAKQL
jgi:hypothetical protein